MKRKPPAKTKRKRAPGGGRKPSTDPGKTVYLWLPGSLYDFLRREAKRRRRALNREIYSRLLASRATYGLPANHYRVAMRIGHLLVEMARRYKNPDFLHNPELLAVFQAAIAQLATMSPSLPVPAGFPIITLPAETMPAAAEGRAPRITPQEAEGRALARAITAIDQTFNPYEIANFGEPL